LLFAAQAAGLILLYRIFF